MNNNLKENLKVLRQIKMDDNTARKQREFLLSTIKAEQLPRESSWQIFWHVLNQPYVFKPLAYVAAMVVLFVSGTFYTMSAANQSTPGEVFYPVKLKFEQLQVALEQNDNQKTKKQIEFADRRLNELTDLSNTVSPLEKQEQIATVVKHFNDSLQDVRQRLEEVVTTEKESVNSESEIVDIVNLVNTKSSDFADVLAVHSDDMSFTVHSTLQKEVEDIKNYSLDLLVARYNQYQDKIPEKLIADQLQEKIINLGEDVSQLTDEEKSAEALVQLSAIQELLEDRQYVDALDGIHQYETWLVSLESNDEVDIEAEVLGVEEINNLKIKTQTTTPTTTSPIDVDEEVEEIE